MNTIKTIYNTSLALLTDLYQLTMAYGYWKAGLADQEAVFHLNTREHPFKGGYTICAGLATVIELLEELRFTENDVSYLSSFFEPAFLTYLQQLKFTVDLDAIEEGRVVFPHEPLIRVKGPLLQCQLLETILLNIINFQSLIATKASRIAYAAQGDPVLEFGLRRAQGFDGGLSASRAAYLGGCAATSNVLAGKLYGIPVKGTHAHSWIMVFNSEQEAFETYVAALPHHPVFLVDTYNTLEGVKNAIAVGEKHSLSGVRLDSGDLATLSIQTRNMLDEAGFSDANIVASGDLDEYQIAELKAKGARINMWGVGTKLCTAYDQPALQIAYKLGATRPSGSNWQYKIKLSEQTSKTSIPGTLQVRRFYRAGKAIGDGIYDEQLGIRTACHLINAEEKRCMPHSGTRTEELLVPVLRKGKLVYTPPSLAESRQRCQEELAKFPASIHKFSKPYQYYVGIEEQLNTLRSALIAKAGK